MARQLPGGYVRLIVLAFAVAVTACFRYRGDLESLPVAAYGVDTTAFRICLNGTNDARRRAAKERQIQWWKYSSLGTGVIIQPGIAQIKPKDTRLFAGLGLSALTGMIALWWPTNDIAITHERNSIESWKQVLAKHAAVVAANSDASKQQLRDAVAACVSTVNSTQGIR
jgi:hypothetical protein